MKKLLIALVALIPTPAMAQVSTTISGMQCPAVYGRAHPDVCTCRYVHKGGE